MLEKTWRFYTILSALLIISAGVATPEVQAASVLLHGGGTHNQIAFSPDSSRLIGFSDVGATRYKIAGDNDWQFLPTNANDASRKVAGGMITNDGLVFQLVGNGNSSGQLQEINISKNTVTVLVSGLNVRGNSKSPGDTGPRPRPVGWLVAYDDANDIVYYATGLGLGRYNRATRTNDGIIALAGEPVREIAHENHAVVSDAQELTVATQTQGMVRLFGVQGKPSAYRISPSSFDRFEDISIIDKASGSMLGMAHTDGVYRYNGTGYLTTNNELISCNTEIPANIATDRYSLEFEGVVDWANTTGDLIGAWGSATAEQTMRLRLDAGTLQFQYRHSGGMFVMKSDYPLTEGFTQMAVRFRPVTTATGVLEKRLPGGEWIELTKAPLSNNYSNKAAVPITIAGTVDESSRLPGTSRVYRASVTKLGDAMPTQSLDVTGLLATDKSALGLNSEKWTWSAAMPLSSGGDIITPAQSSGKGTNGAAVRWTASAVMGVGGTMQAAIATVNPGSSAEWVYRTTDVEVATNGDWDNATPTPATLKAGSKYFSPANRVYGQSGRSGKNLTGTYGLAFDTSDESGNTLISTATLSIYRTENFAGVAKSIAWSSYNQGSSMLSISDAHIDTDGNLFFAAADHNSFAVLSADKHKVEPTRVPLSGVHDGWSIGSIGSGANKVVLFAAAEDKRSHDPGHDFVYYRGAGIPSKWNTTGYQADLAGIGKLAAGGVPRPGSSFGWDNGDGSYGVVTWADDIGFVRNTYTLASDTWGTWRLQSSGPGSNLNTGNVNQEREIVGAANGSVIFGVQLSDGQIWRSLDKGANWTAIAKSMGTKAAVRTARLVYLDAGDILVASDANGLYRINSASSAAKVTQIAGITTASILASDSSDRVYAHIRGPGLIDLLRFDDIATAEATTDATQIGSEKYQARVGDLANAMTIGMSSGKEIGITTYQGAGALFWDVPE